MHALTVLCDTIVNVCFGRLVAQGEGLLVRWAQEQSQAALQGLHTARQALLDLQAQSQKQRQNQNAKRCAPAATSLPLCFAPNGTPLLNPSCVTRNSPVWCSATFPRSLAYKHTSL